MALAALTFRHDYVPKVHSRLVSWPRKYARGPEGLALRSCHAPNLLGVMSPVLGLGSRRTRRMAATSGHKDSSLSTPAEGTLGAELEA